MERVQALESLARDERIDLRGREASVTQQHLDRAKVRAVVEEVRGERMAQDVG